MAFAAPCPTRCGTQVLSLRDVVRSKDAFKIAVIAEEWEDVSSGLANKNDHEVLKIITGVSNTKFWAEADITLTMTQPVMDAIHTVQADKPLLS
jgi:hypothetical protein